MSDPIKNTISDNAAQVVSLLGKPTSFLLFLFAVLVLFEFSNYYKTQRMVTLYAATMQSMETNRSREVAAQQQLVSDLIDIVEYSTGANRKEQEQSKERMGIEYPR